MITLPRQARDKQGLSLKRNAFPYRPGVNCECESPTYAVGHCDREWLKFMNKGCIRCSCSCAKVHSGEVGYTDWQGTYHPRSDCDLTIRNLRTNGHNALGLTALPKVRSLAHGLCARAHVFLICAWYVVCLLSDYRTKEGRRLSSEPCIDMPETAAGLRVEGHSSVLRVFNSYEKRAG